MIKKNKWFLLLLLGFAIFYFWRYKVPPSIDYSEIRVELEDGRLTALSDLHDGPLLVNFYASWCGPCMSEMQSLQRAHEQGRFTVIGLTDDPIEKVEAVRAHYKLSFPLHRLSGSLKDQGIYSIPTTYLLGSDGEVLESMIGPQEWDSEEFMNKAALRLSKER